MPNLGLQAHVNRVKRMIQRDRSHPSIIVWSIGNEAGTGQNLKLAYQNAKHMDKTRPVVYGFDGGEGYTDIVFPMYTEQLRHHYDSSLWTLSIFSPISQLPPHTRRGLCSAESPC